MQPKKILFISNGFYPKARGAEIQMENLARFFLKKGHKIEVLTLKYDNQLPDFETIKGLKVLRISYPHIKGLGTLMYLLKFTLTMWKEIKKWDVFYVVIPEYLAFIVSVLGAIYNKKVILKFTGIGDLGAGYINKLFLPKLLFWGIRKAAFFIAVSQTMAEDIYTFRFPNGRIKLIPNAVDTEQFIPVASTDKEAGKKKFGLDSEFVAIFVGKLIDFKGVEYLVEAWKEFVADKSKNAVLLMAGTGPLQQQLESFISKHNLQKNIKLLGVRRDISDLMQLSDIFILPSYTEGLSNTLLEAMSCGLPPVCTEISGNIDLVKNNENGLLYKAGDAKALYDQICLLYEKRNLINTFGEKARETIINYCSPDTIYDKYMELIEL
jgi:glycosyltransferase involved in cell wall biosynthesis